MHNHKGMNCNDGFPGRIVLFTPSSVYGLQNGECTTSLTVGVFAKVPLQDMTLNGCCRVCNHQLAALICHLWIYLSLSNQLEGWHATIWDVGGEGLRLCFV